MPPHKWYTNMESDPYMPFGPNIEIIAKFNSNKPDRQSKWKLINDRGNLSSKYGTVRPGLRHSSVNESRHTFGGSGTHIRCFKNWLEVPDVGGDIYTVECRKKVGLRSDKVLTESYENWRRLWFSIYTTDASQTDVLDDVIQIFQEAFEEAFIDFKKAGTGALNFDHTYALIDDIRYPMAFGYSFIKVLYPRKTWPTLKKKPHHLLVHLVKQCAKLHVVPLETKVIKFTILWNQQTINQEDFFECPDRSFLINQAGDKVIFKLPEREQKVLLDDAMRKQEADDLGQTPAFGTNISKCEVSTDGGNSYSDITADARQKWAFIDYKTFSLSLTGTLQNLELPPESQTTELHFKTEVKMADTLVAGQSSGNLVIVQTHKVNRDNGNWEIQSAEKLAKTLIHEIGHSVGLVPDKFKKRKGEETNPNHYTKHGGSGRHCKHNAALNANDVYVHKTGAGKMCVMLHCLDPEAGPEFCPNCHKALLLAKLKGSDLESRDVLKPGWNKYAS